MFITSQFFFINTWLVYTISTFFVFRDLPTSATSATSVTSTFLTSPNFAISWIPQLSTFANFPISWIPQLSPISTFANFAISWIPGSSETRFLWMCQLLTFCDIWISTFLGIPPELPRTWGSILAGSDHPLGTPKLTLEPPSKPPRTTPKLTPNYP